jgi:hypothetical protein
LAVGVGRDGRVLLICRSAGCSFESILAAMKMTKADLFAPKANGTANYSKDNPRQAFPTCREAVAELERQHGPRAALWAYKNTTGEQVGAVVRWNLGDGGKTIRPVAKSSDGWRVAAMPTPRPLYDLPALAEAKLVVVVEGEKAAEAAKSIGFVATTSAGGAQASAKTDWSPLAGKTVWILPDNDQPGQKYAAEVVGILAKLTPPALMKVVNLPGLPDGGDVVDWIDAHGDAAEPETFRVELEGLAHSVGVASDVPPVDPPIPPRFRFYTSAELAETNFDPKWLVRNILVEGEPCIAAGAEKTLKTSIVSVDLGVSIASGTSFLSCDQFSVPRARTVAVVSGESGMRTLKETAIRVCVARGLSLNGLDGQLIWCPDLPLLPDAASMSEFVKALTDRKVEVLMLDPMYLLLGDVDERSIFRVGALLRIVAEMLAKNGITLVLLHHANRRGEDGAVMTLKDIAYAGFAAFARQYILLSRRTEYKQDGEHALWMNVGGSAGHGCLRAVDVFEGMIDENFAGRRWDVSVSTTAEMKQTAEEVKATRKVEEQARKRQEDEAIVLQAIDSISSQGRPPTVNAIRSFAGGSGSRWNDVLYRLVEDDILSVEREKVGHGSGGGKDRDVYRRAGSERPTGPTGKPVGQSDSPDARNQPRTPTGNPPIGGTGGLPVGCSPEPASKNTRGNRSCRRSGNLPAGRGATA